MIPLRVRRSSKRASVVGASRLARVPELVGVRVAGHEVRDGVRAALDGAARVAHPSCRRERDDQDAGEADGEREAPAAAPNGLGGDTLREPRDKIVIGLRPLLS